MRQKEYGGWVKSVKQFRLSLAHEGGLNWGDRIISNSFNIYFLKRKTQLDPKVTDENSGVQLVQ